MFKELTYKPSSLKSLSRIGTGQHLTDSQAGTTEAITVKTVPVVLAMVTVPNIIKWHVIKF